jgi:hypothetical protein
MLSSALISKENQELMSLKYVFWWRVVTGFLGSVVILTNWRLFPAVGVSVVGFALETALALERGCLSYLFRYFRALICGLAIPFVAVLFGIFHGDITRYYKHFFGFFKQESGWGAFTEGAFEIFPEQLLVLRWLVHAVMIILIILAIFFPAPGVPRRSQFWIWIPLLTLLWLSISAAYYFNRSGGGIYYFGVCYIMMAFHIARSVYWKRISYPWVKEVLLALFICGLPWKAVGIQTLRLWQSLQPAREFIAETRRLTGGSFVQSEAYYFFKERYDGEVIDMGDVVSKVRLTGYFGSEFDATANKYFYNLHLHPPELVMAGIGSPEMTELLQRYYDPILVFPPHLWPYLGSPATLYRLSQIKNCDQSI